MCRAEIGKLMTRPDCTIYVDLCLVTIYQGSCFVSSFGAYDLSYHKRYTSIFMKITI